VAELVNASIVCARDPGSNFDIDINIFLFCLCHFGIQIFWTLNLKLHMLKYMYIDKQCNHNVYVDWDHLKCAINIY
jgi:hypothetical protein